MTVSDWGSAGSPRSAAGMAPGFTRLTEPGANALYIHPAHGGLDPRTIAQARAPAQPQAQTGGYPGPAPYGAAPKSAPAGSAQAETTAQAGGGVLNILGAAVSAALVVGLAVWGYELAMRDVTGVPVVRALEGPMRIQPEDPGGAVAPHQGLAVNDVPADGASAGPVDRVMLSPPATELAADDVPAFPEVDVTSLDQRPAVMPASGGEIDADAAVAEALGLTDMPGEDAFFGTPIEVIPESVPGVTRSPRPMPRPSNLDLSEIAAPDRVLDVSAPISAPISAATPPPARPAQVEATPDVVLGVEVPAAALDPASRLVQLGAYKTPEAARARWKDFAALNPVLFHKRNWTIVEGASGGEAFFRLRATGFSDIEDARGFCAALIAAEGTCVPVLEG